ncbi:MAG: hypothetical protein SNH41_00590 [Rikenellaceae bacterium]
MRFFRSCTRQRGSILRYVTERAYAGSEKYRTMIARFMLSGG